MINSTYLASLACFACRIIDGTFELIVLDGGAG